MKDPDHTQSPFNTPAAQHWKLIGLHHHHGINIPLFSLHSQTSSGIGEYPDLLPFISWCNEIGFDIIQLLPLNDTGNDQSPYSALSAYALNPIHLGLHLLPHSADDPFLVKLLKELRELNACQRIPYPQVHVLKETFLKYYFQNYFSLFSQSADYLVFKQSNSWLKEYGLFKAIKLQRNWQSWEDWPSEYKGLNDRLYEEEIEFHSFVQYLCFKQMEEVKRKASQHGIFIKGDIPILINRESADVWFSPEKFLLDFSAGAPPDMYSKEGQKWGFPIYNWEVLEKEGYRWWIQRLALAAHCYHLYRIDHIVGFYRIWSIPHNLPPKEGYFIPEDKALWVPHGEKIMRMMLENCSLLPIGEDLGTIPPEVRISLHQLGISGTKVMRWERKWHGDQTFIHPFDYPADSMTTVSTHDSETLQQWWSDQPKEAQIYADQQDWTYYPELSPKQRLSILHASHHSSSFFHINLLQEYLAFFPEMVWPDPKDERVNIPGIISDVNWTYRFRPSVEEIINHPELKHLMRQIRENGYNGRLA